MIEKEADSAYTLRTPTESLLVEKRSVLRRETTADSLMPQGLLAPLSESDVRDLIAYLASLKGEE